MTPIYAKKLNFQLYKTDIRAQKIDGSSLTTYNIVIAGFQFVNKLGKAYFFQKIFLLVNFSVEVILEILFLTFNNANVIFIN